MAAYMLVMIRLGADQSWREGYRDAVGEMIHAFGGEYCIRSNGTPIIALEGEACVPDRMAIIRFPSMAAAQAFVAHPEYQPYRLARQLATHTAIWAIEAD